MVGLCITSTSDIKETYEKNAKESFPNILEASSTLYQYVKINKTVY